MNRIIIGLAGRKGAGKSSAARHLVRSGFGCLSFAAVIRAMLVPLLMGFGYLTYEIEKLANEDKEKKIEPLGKSFRELMQLLGTEWGRNLIHKDLWTMAARCQIDRLSNRNIVFDDVRFDNEAELIRSLGGLIIHINRGMEDQADDHASESGIEGLPGDMYINNDNTLDYFLVEISLVVAGLLRS
jgi:hypothetical protein